jgi:hypothetical protein
VTAPKEEPNPHKELEQVDTELSTAEHDLIVAEHNLEVGRAGRWLEYRKNEEDAGKKPSIEYLNKMVMRDEGAEKDSLNTLWGEFERIDKLVRQLTPRKWALQRIVSQEINRW